jgi:hypothetical protein
VLERPGVAGALRRSLALTRGHRLAICSLLIILGVLEASLSYGLRMLAMTAFDLPLFVYASLVNNMVTASISAVIASVAYHCLRAEKQGASPAELATIFD